MSFGYLKTFFKTQKTLFESLITKLKISTSFKDIDLYKLS